MNRRDVKGRWVSTVLILVFGLLAAGIGTTSNVYYRNCEERLQIGVQNRLSTNGNRRLGELLRWSRERLGGALILFKNRALNLLNPLDSPDPPAVKVALERRARESGDAPVMAETFAVLRSPGS